ncbi:hypothetical protein [Halococcus thailandensis]|uniref:Uncharacterized protein n=1 Tax=Halococcus thailandensis JCM 13552 TaxID=1227457 RepID=M0N028_9EURY|nr:hypothetical protein [Halococcus thailandensis]EMA51226.1 hypothetical protein C451_16068 [Halococcus thailandensis JCM 13552]
MSAIRHTPGPAAAEAFTFGIAIATVTTLAGIGFLVWTGVLTVIGAVATLLLGLPALLLIVSCLLSVWLGYDRDAVDVALS